MHKAACVESSLLHPFIPGHVLGQQQAEPSPAAQETPGMSLCPYKSWDWQWVQSVALAAFGRALCYLQWNSRASRLQKHGVFIQLCLSGVSRGEKVCPGLFNHFILCWSKQEEPRGAVFACEALLCSGFAARGAFAVRAQSSCSARRER